MEIANNSLVLNFNIMGKMILREKSILFRGNPGKKYVFQGKTQGNMYLFGGKSWKMEGSILSEPCMLLPPKFEFQ